MTVDEPRARYGRLFAVGEFRALFAAHVISLLGDVVASVAMTVLVYARTHSPALAALTFSLAFLPYLFAGTLLSAVVDRLPARRVLVACDLASALIVGAMAALQLPVAALLALLFTLGLIAPVFSGVRAATLSDVLPDQATFVLGRAVIRLAAQLSQVVGYLAGGLLLFVLSPRGALVADAVSFLLAALLLRLWTKKRPRRVAVSDLPMLRDSLQGLRAVLGLPVVRRLLLFGWLLPASLAAPEALAAIYVHDLGRPAGAVGLYLAGLPAGTALGDLWAARFVSASGQRRLVSPGALLCCAPLLGFLARPRLDLAFALLLVAGLGSAYMPGYDQYLLDAVDEPLRGRTLAAHSAGLMFGQGVGFALWGLLAEFLEPRFVIPLAAAAGVLVVCLWRPRASTGTRIAPPSSGNGAG